MLENRMIEFGLKNGIDIEESTLRAPIGADIELATDLANSTYKDCFSFASDVTLCSCFKGHINIYRHKHDTAGWTDPVSVRSINYHKKEI